MKRVFFGLLLLALANTAFADTVECVSLDRGNTINVRIDWIEDFNNCFSLISVPQNKSVTFVAFSGDVVRNKITLFDLNEGGVSDYVAEYNSDVGASTAFTSNTTNRALGFRITPTTHLNSDKLVSVTYLEVADIAQIVIDLTNIPVHESDTPITAGCRYHRGIRICRDEL
jgi:hypothetical protein